MVIVVVDVEVVMVVLMEVMVVEVEEEAIEVVGSNGSGVTWLSRKATSFHVF